VWKSRLTKRMAGGAKRKKRALLKVRVVERNAKKMTKEVHEQFCRHNDDDGSDDDTVCLEKCAGKSDMSIKR
jgi:hypothetical protein